MLLVSFYFFVMIPAWAQPNSGIPAASGSPLHPVNAAQPVEPNQKHVRLAIAGPSD